MNPNGPARGASTDALRRFIDAVRTSPVGSDDAERVERIRLFEELKGVVSAAQMTEAAAFDRSQRTAQAIAGEPPQRQGRGVAAQVALARRVSPWQASRWLGWAKILPVELPATFAELRAGRISEWRAILVARETAVLSREHRARVDAELAPKLVGWGDARVAAETRKAALRLDAAAAVARAQQAETERRVTVRPAPDTMCWLTALLPAAQGIAAWAALNRVADSHPSESRGRGQLMADTLVERVTGQASAAAVPVEVSVTVSVDSLLGDGVEPAWLDGYGPVPAGTARDLARGVSAPVWLRRLFTRPVAGNLVAMESTRRTFPEGLARFVRLRDRTCRTPWCDAPIRHIDHVRAWGDGGATDAANAQGLCEACNHAKQAPGWRSRAAPDGAVEITTPTGATYRTLAPDDPCAARLSAGAA